MVFLLYYFSSYFVEPAAGLFEGDIFADAPLTTTVLPPGAMTSRTESDDDMDHYDGGAPSPAMRYVHNIYEKFQRFPYKKKSNLF